MYFRLRFGFETATNTYLWLKIRVEFVGMCCEIPEVFFVAE